MTTHVQLAAATTSTSTSTSRARRASRRHLLARRFFARSTTTTPTTTRAATTDDDASTGDVVGVVVVDHGSRRAASNEQLERFAELYAAATGRAVVEAAHMELAPPTIAEAFGRCVERGATLVVVAPFFLSPGRHWQEDIPALVDEAAAAHPGVKYLISAPIGLHPLMSEVIDSRVRHCMAHVYEGAPACDVCAGSKFGCELKRGAGMGAS
jgi:sirohydrochlorin ferrochelatase